MNRVELTRRSPGVNFNSANEAEIMLWAPFAKTVAISLLNSGEQLSLNKADYDRWELTTDRLKPKSRYKFILDGKKEFPDPASLSQPEGVHGPSEATDLRDFLWTDKQWKNIPLEDYRIYELHTGTFTPEGTFQGIETKLEHLQQLGVNAIEIMPVAQFPGNRNWGYDGVFPYAVQNSYGGVNGLRHLVTTCHEKGFAVILDVVYNHLGPEGNYLSEFGPYFTEKYHTPWGNALNFDDAWCDNVRQYFIENALMWFRDFHIDALRLDAVHAIKDFSPVHILQEIKQYVNRLADTTGRPYYLIAETDLNDTRFIDPLSDRGYGMDAQWTDEFHHALRVTAGGNRTGYYSDFNGISHLAKAYTDAYVYDGIYSTHRRKTFGSKATDRPGQQFVVFSQNHDQVGNRMLGERSSELSSFEMQKLLAGAVMAGPYLPMLFMGEEWSEPHPFLYFVSHGDPELVEAVRNGRKAEFADFHAQGETPDPQAEETFERSKLQWYLLEQGSHGAMFSYYQALIAVRRELPALSRLNRKQLEATCDEQSETLLLHRWHENQHVVCMMNFSKEKQRMILPDDRYRWQKALDSADPKWLGPAAAPEILKESSVDLQPESILIYHNIHA